MQIKTFLFIAIAIGCASAENAAPSPNKGAPMSPMNITGDFGDPKWRILYPDGNTVLFDDDESPAGNHYLYYCRYDEDGSLTSRVVSYTGKFCGGSSDTEAGGCNGLPVTSGCSDANPGAGVAPWTARCCFSETHNATTSSH
jgi:hypothetical protein